MLVQLTRLERCRNLMMKGDLVGVGSHNAAHLVDHRVHRVTFQNAQNCVVCLHAGLSPECRGLYRLKDRVAGV